MGNMICDNCKEERKPNDFINKQKFCYRCVYREKVKNSPKIRKEKKFFCRMCKKEIVQIKDLRKRQRSVFCSVECAIAGHQEITKNYWTRTLRKGEQRKNGKKIAF